MFEKEAEKKAEEMLYKNEIHRDAVKLFLVTCNLGKYSKLVNSVKSNGVNLKGEIKFFISLEIAKGDHFKNDLELRYFIVMTDVKELSKEYLVVEINNVSKEFQIKKENDYNYTINIKD